MNNVNILGKIKERIFSSVPIGAAGSLEQTEIVDEQESFENACDESNSNE